MKKTTKTSKLIKCLVVTPMWILCVVSLTLWSADNLDLAIGSPLKGSLSTGVSELDIKVPCIKGDYLAGYLDSVGSALSLDVINAEGKMLRQLIHNKTGKNHFYLVAENCPEIWRLSGMGTYKIELEAQVSISEQVPPKIDSPLSPRINALENALKQGNTTDKFWVDVEKSGTPIIEKIPSGTLMTFLARGEYSNVKLLGGPSNDHEPLKQLGQSDTWYRSFVVPADTQLSYQIAPNVPYPPFSGFARRVAIKAVAQQDPYNHFPWPDPRVDKYSNYSTIKLSPPTKEPSILPIETDEKGTLSTFSFSSNTLANTRDITVYTPVITSPNPLLLYIFDAQKYLELVKLPKILDQLIAQKKIPPVIAVFISNPDAAARANELPANNLFADVLANELAPQINKKLNISIPNTRTIIAGSSYGGLAATSIALRHPHIFGNVISMSGSFWWAPQEQRITSQHYIANRFITMPQKPIRFFLSAGLFENSRYVGDGILETNRHLRDVLLAKGYTTYHKEYSAGHDYFSWRDIIADGLLTLFPKM
ncbi:alpha/beta hydrolase [Paraglaciecola marina]|uniref:alpha/beta hydrolase n=1 Tax=Paraglaciecola marina TaxID=2500157 RepID=UPI00105E1855|nr:alpha/beta hydrolase-fold protein [Paraglaciecola marina]